MSFFDNVLIVTLLIDYGYLSKLSYNPFEVLHLDHIEPLTKDAHGNEYILVIIDRRQL